MNFKDTLESLMILPIWHSILIKGIHGKGKTECVRLASKILGAGYHDERLSQCDVGDLKGMPFFINGRTVFAMPEWYPLREEDASKLKEMLNLDTVSMGMKESVGYLALEEIDRATRQVQQASFELALDRRLNMRPIRPGWRVIACVNGDDDIYQVLDMDPAFIDRWVEILFRPSTEEWLNHARGLDSIEDRNWSKITPEFLIELESKYKGKVHPAVIEFITRYPTMLDPTKQQIEENPGKKLQSRRSWTRFSEAIYVTDEFRKQGLTDKNFLGKSMDDLSYLLGVANGYVGEFAAAQFHTFIKTDYQSLNADTILNKWSDTVRSRLQKIAEENGTTELAQYNRIIPLYVSDNNIEELNDTQSLNLIEYIKVLPKEVRSDFWKQIMAGAKETALKWYRGKYKKDISKHLLDAMTDPTMMRK